MKIESYKPAPRKARCIELLHEDFSRPELHDRLANVKKLIGIFASMTPAIVDDSPRQLCELFNRLPQHPINAKNLESRTKNPGVKRMIRAFFAKRLNGRFSVQKIERCTGMSLP